MARVSDSAGRRSRRYWSSWCTARRSRHLRLLRRLQQLRGWRDRRRGHSEPRWGIARQAVRLASKRKRKGKRHRKSAFRLSSDQRGSSPLLYSSQDDPRWYHGAFILGCGRTWDRVDRAVLQTKDDSDPLSGRRKVET